MNINEILKETYETGFQGNRFPSLTERQEEFINDDFYQEWTDWAGAGKTTALLLASLRGTGDPNYHGLIAVESHDLVRYVADQLTLMTECRFNKSTETFSFVPGGARLRVMHFKDIEDVQKVWGMEFNFIGTDNVHSEVENGLKMRLRSRHLPCRMRVVRHGEPSIISVPPEVLG